MSSSSDPFGGVYGSAALAASASPMQSTDNSSILKQAFIVIAITLAALLMLISIRFGFNVVVDICLLGQAEAYSRMISNWWRRVCPWWHRRTVPEEGRQSGDSPWMTDEEGGTGVLGRNRTYHLQKLPLYRRKRLLEEVLPAKVLTAEDIASFAQPKNGESKAVCKDANETLAPENGTSNSVEDPAPPAEDIVGNDADGPDPDDDASLCSQNSLGILLCSICLHELKVGDTVLVSKCEHVFHHSCIAEWVVENCGSDCPYCRAELISPADVEQLEMDDVYKESLETAVVDV
jgi:hypothetical protein